MSRSPRLLFWVFAAGLLFVLAAPARAIPLSDLLGGGFIDFNGLRFSMFAYSSTGDMPDAEDVEVITIVDAMGHSGIRFQGAFIDTSSPPFASDAGISFKVSVIDDGPLISDAHIFGDPTLIPDDVAEGFVSVTETIDTGDEVVQMEIFAFSDPELGSQFQDWVFFDPTDELDMVLKDILASATQGVAAVTIIDQTFSRVPEPGTLLLLGVGLLGLAVAGRTRA